MIQLVKLPVKRGNAPLRIAKGHFVTNHSHINYYVDITFQKTRLSEARDSAYPILSTILLWIRCCVWMAPRCWAPVSLRS